MTYVNTPAGWMTTGNRANGCGAARGCSVCTIVLIQRWAVEMLGGASVSTCHPGWWSVRFTNLTPQTPTHCNFVPIAAPNEHITLLLRRFRWQSMCGHDQRCETFQAQEVNAARLQISLQRHNPSIHNIERQFLYGHLSKLSAFLSERAPLNEIRRDNGKSSLVQRIFDINDQTQSKPVLPYFGNSYVDLRTIAGVANEHLRRTIRQDLTIQIPWGQVLCCSISADYY